MDQTGNVTLQLDDGIAVVTLSHPGARNAMSWTMLEQLASIWDQVEAEDDVEVVVLTGADGDFCSGGDLKSLAGEALATATGGGASMERLFEVAFRALQRERRVDLPTISAIEGVAIGGGLEIVLGTDIRIAADSARLALPEVRRGLFPAAGGVVRCLQQLPYPVAAQLLLTGEEITAQRALQIGLVGEVVPDGTALDRALEVARAIRRNSPASVRGVTSVLRAMKVAEEAEPLAIELQGGLAALQSGDAEVGVAAFREKSTADYR